eukprot:CAMPEP_0206244264 /NCGR_PEP_ID=MMETSP0047_2-20121206/18059_1 /ASSEMBLY_ACC=CAM_ASM_000192 /TAXON_ID=195065 /ORGANISM="Chroomonas mesostigmatica_cf, Strain CCMP1168" /LENGTH=648 /DNA_ID=CAMNT_0053669461 /DNA_START=158 /DNA_END=2101 /DNA_ORIENTATION=+
MLPLTLQRLACRPSAAPTPHDARPRVPNTPVCYNEGSFGGVKSYQGTSIPSLKYQYTLTKLRAQTLAWLTLQLAEPQRLTLTRPHEGMKGAYVLLPHVLRAIPPHTNWPNLSPAHFAHLARFRNLSGCPFLTLHHARPQPGSLGTLAEPQRLPLAWPHEGRVRDRSGLLSRVLEVVPPHDLVQQQRGLEDREVLAHAHELPPPEGREAKGLAQRGGPVVMPLGDELLGVRDGVALRGARVVLVQRAFGDGVAIHFEALCHLSEEPRNGRLEPKDLIDEVGSVGASLHVCIRLTALGVSLLLLPQLLDHVSILRHGHVVKRSSNERHRRLVAREKDDDDLIDDLLSAQPLRLTNSPHHLRQHVVADLLPLVEFLLAIGYHVLYDRDQLFPALQALCEAPAEPLERGRKGTIPQRHNQVTCLVNQGRGAEAHPQHHADRDHHEQLLHRLERLENSALRERGDVLFNPPPHVLLDDGEVPLQRGVVERWKEHLLDPRPFGAKGSGRERSTAPQGVDVWVVYCRHHKLAVLTLAREPHLDALSPDDIVRCLAEEGRAEHPAVLIAALDPQLPGSLPLDVREREGEEGDRVHDAAAGDGEVAEHRDLRRQPRPSQPLHYARQDGGGSSGAQRAHRVVHQPSVLCILMQGGDQL